MLEDRITDTKIKTIPLRLFEIELQYNEIVIKYFEDENDRKRNKFINKKSFNELRYISFNFNEDEYTLFHYFEIMELIELFKDFTNNLLDANKTYKTNNYMAKITQQNKQKYLKVIFNSYKNNTKTFTFHFEKLDTGYLYQILNKLLNNFNPLYQE